MVRKYDIDEVDRRTSFTYWLAVVLIVTAWIFAFKCYFSSYENKHPDITWAAPGTNRQIATVKGFYLWEEEVIKTPCAGKVYYPHGEGPVRVSKGQGVAKIVSESGEKILYASRPGYFIAGTDGKEGNWRYSLLWPDITDRLPETDDLTMHRNGDEAAANAVIGKLIPQPQNLRFVGLADKDSVTAVQLRDKKLRLMMDAEDTSSPADVNISVENGDKIKFLLVMPWFNMNVVKSRSGKINIESGSEDGAFVPSSAVTERHGKKGVFLVRGTRVVFKKIKGVEMPGGKYLITEGLNVGDAVVTDAKNTKEGRVQIW